MKIELSKLILDKQNQRFINPHEVNQNEESIFNYLLQFEVLDELIAGIARAGFFQIGDRVVVQKDPNSENYIVLEGNRRICALKALHGYYHKHYEFNQVYLDNSRIIDVDVVTTREEIQPYLAARHIQGLKLWKAEARRNFYYKHYQDGKSLSFIQQITQQNLSEIKKYIKQLTFLDFFKRHSGNPIINQPSLIYERILSYSIELNLIEEINVTELSTQCTVTVKENIITIEKLIEFYTLLIDTIIGPNCFVDSRTINDINDFRKVLQSDKIIEYWPRLKELYLEISIKNDKTHFIPYQNIDSAIIGKIPSINKIIDYSIISQDCTIKVYKEDNTEISVSDFYSSNVGMYYIHINNFRYSFKIKNLSLPKIYINSPALSRLMINSTIDISKFIQISDVFDDKIDIHNTYVKLSTTSRDVVITSTNNIVLQSAGNFLLTVEYSYNDDLNYTISETFILTGLPNTGLPRVETQSGYFDFKYLDVKSIINFTMAGTLIMELEDAYAKKHNHIFASALRSFLDLCLEDFRTKAQSLCPTSKWAVATTENKLKEEFKKLTMIDISKIATEYTKLLVSRNPAKSSDFHPLLNHLETNITSRNIDSVIGALHLGAHKSLKKLFDANFVLIQPILLCWIELIFIIEELNFI